MKTRIFYGTAPQRSVNTVLMTRRKVSNLYIYKSLEQNSIYILKLDILSWSLANFYISICRRNYVLSQGFLKEKNLSVWIQDEETSWFFYNTLWGQSSVKGTAQRYPNQLGHQEWGWSTYSSRHCLYIKEYAWIKGKTPTKPKRLKHSFVGFVCTANTSQPTV